MEQKKRKVFLGCIADDFTGAGDAASFLADAGLSVVLLNGIPEEGAVPEADAYVIALKSRTAPVRDAVRETLCAASWLKKQGAEMLYLKYCSTFDSTEQGNIGPTADALLEELHLPYTILCPSLPVNGRRVRNGRLSVNGIPLHESSMRNHPLTPMKDDRLKELMQAQSRYPAFVVTEEELQGEGLRLPEKLKGRISEWEKKYGHFYLIPDYYEDAHAERIAEVFGMLPLITGGSGLIGALGARFLEDCREAGTGNVKGQKPGGAVLLSGSCSEMTLRQVAMWQESGGRSFLISPEKLLGDPENAEEIFSCLSRSGMETVLFYSSLPAVQVREIQKAGAEKVSALLEKVTAELALKSLEMGKTRIIVAGGETSGAVTKALGFDSFYIWKSIAPGVPVMIPCKRPDIRLVLKSGNFGDETFFRKALEMTEE